MEQKKTVFISYRREKSKHLARAIYQDLRMHGWDAFLDVTTIDAGDFDRIILNQIAARAHFILLVSPGALERCTSPGDWLRREIEEAVRLDRNIVPVIEEGADFERELSHLPDELREVVRRKNGLPLPHFYFEAAMDALRTRFLKTPEYVRIQETPPADRAEVRRRMAAAEAPLAAPARPRSVDLLPAPFGWVEIPRRGYSIAKYPVTNAQFALFVEAGGYRERQWWTKAGWKAREQGWHYDYGRKPSGTPWTEPRFWREAKWNGPEQPVAGVSWYEAVAFCLWLSDVTGEKIMLPTEEQWQYAAQGDDGRMYPWGDAWDCQRCNNSVPPCKSNGTTPVTRYEGRGDSYFGVVDMAGNVWEWCLTDYDSRSNDVNSDAAKRVLRGGSWYGDQTDFFRCGDRYGVDPRGWSINFGFRPARS